VCDQEGPVRKFFTKSEAMQWVKTRPELILKINPKQKEPSVFETTPEAIF